MLGVIDFSFCSFTNRFPISRTSHTKMVKKKKNGQNKNWSGGKCPSHANIFICLVIAYPELQNMTYAGATL